MALGYAYSILGDFHLAQDAAQESFLDAQAHLEQLRRPEAFPGWFKTIVFKRCDRLRRGKRIDTGPLELANATASDENDPAAATERRELYQAVATALRSLDSGQREVAALYYMSGYSQREIGDFLGVPVSTVKSRLFSARKSLRPAAIKMVGQGLFTLRPSSDDTFTRSVTLFLDTEGNRIALLSRRHEENLSPS